MIKRKLYGTAGEEAIDRLAGRMPVEFDISRYLPQGDAGDASQRVAFCLDQIEKRGFKKGIHWGSELAHHLTVEEVVGALVAAEQSLNDFEEYG